MSARMRWGAWVAPWGFLVLGLVVLAGCRSSSGSRSGGCGNSCCGGETSAVSRTTVPISSAAVAQQPVLPSAADQGPGLASVDSRPYGGQKTCPVMDEPLGSMGPAIPVTVRGQTIYVCCRGCASKVQRDPDRYLAKVTAERAGQ